MRDILSLPPCTSKAFKSNMVGKERNRELVLTASLPRI